MQSDADRLVFIDSDVAWEMGDVLKIALRPEPFVGGAYRYKADDEGYPVHFLDHRPAPNDAGLIPVGLLPGGFLSLSREVFGALYAKHGNTRAYEFAGQTFYAFFHCPPGDGEDGAFCRDWRDAGGEVLMDPTLRLTHVDAAGRKFTGCIGDWLKGKING